MRELFATLVGRLKRTESPTGRYALLRAAALAHAARRAHIVRARAVREYLRSSDEPRLHIGAGPVRLPGWLNSDLISGDIHLDLLRPLPLPPASFAYVFGEHVIEHLPEGGIGAILAELHRVLRPGGVLRLTTPDLQKLVALYEDRNPVVSREMYARYLDSQTGKRHDRPAQIFNNAMRLWGHRYIYDEEDLTARLHAVGFDQVERVEPRESRHAALLGLERHGGEEWVNRAEAMCLEATRAR